VKAIDEKLRQTSATAKLVMDVIRCEQPQIKVRSFSIAFYLCTEIDRTLKQ
jgi:hypothetical protein